ncbi:MAG: RNA polymerase sigma factor [Patescibacteria group bacterium]
MTFQLAKKYQEKKTISRLKNKDKEVFIKVYDDFGDDIYRFVYFKVGGVEEAKDLTSMIFLKTWNHIQNNTLTSADTLRALIYKIARTSIVDYYRETGSKLEISLDDEENPIDIPDEKRDITADLDKNADLERIKSKLPYLKEEYREIIVLKFINDLEIEEISDVTGKSKGNVRVLLHRALNALKDLVSEEEKTEL